MESEPLCTLAADTGQLFQFINESSHRLGEL
jgi:hypothetical protein